MKIKIYLIYNRNNKSKNYINLKNITIKKLKT